MQNAPHFTDSLQTNPSDSIRWFAIRVKAQCERNVATAIRNKGFEEFLPFYTGRRRWSDRFTIVELPLFPGYVFCRLDPRFRLPVLTTPGVLHFVGVGRTLAPLDDAEISAVQQAVQSGLPTLPSQFVEVGQRVRLDHGPLKGLEGILVEVRRRYRVVVSVSLLARSMAVEIERQWVTPLDQTPAPRRLKALA